MSQSLQLVALVSVLALVIIVGDYFTSRDETPVLAPSVGQIEIAKETSNKVSVDTSSEASLAPVPTGQLPAKEAEKVVPAVVDRVEIPVETPKTNPITVPTSTLATDESTSIPTTTVALKTDGAKTFSCDIDEQINNQTLGGIDANNNLVRDDVECSINARYKEGSEKHTILMRHAKSIQAVLTGKILYSEAELANTERFEYGNEPRIQQYTDILECLKDKSIMSELSAQTDRIINTPERSREYGTVLAGAIIEIDGMYCDPKYTWWD